MTLKERIRTDWEAIHSAPPEKKWRFFLDYYKWPALVCLAALLIVISSVHTAVTAKEPYLSGIAINSSSVTNTEGFLELENSLLVKNRIRKLNASSTSEKWYPTEQEMPDSSEMIQCRYTHPAWRCFSAALPGKRPQSKALPDIL